jgi:hypothetical protein
MRTNEIRFRMLDDRSGVELLDSGFVLVLVLWGYATKRCRQDLPDWAR